MPVMAKPQTPAIEIEVGDRVVKVTNPDRVYFPETGWTKHDLVDYYLAVGPGIVRALRERPCMLHRFPDGLAGPKVHQKRLPAGAPDWVQTVELWFPRYGRTADELCVTELAQVIWAVQMSTVEFHPWNSRRGHVEQPDEWRIDLDPTNNHFADSRYIVTAWGRDFRDVSPLKGVVYTEAAKSTLEVKVDVFRVNPDGTLS